MFRMPMFHFTKLGFLLVLTISCLTVPMKAEFQVNVFTADDQMNPDVAISPNGDFVIVWESQWQEEDWSEIYGRRFSADGQPLSDEFRINNNTVDIQASSSIAMDSAGNFVVTWRSMNCEDDDEDIYARHYNAAGVPVGYEFQVNTYTQRRQIDPQIAMNDSGRYVITWESDLQPDPYSHTAYWNVCGRVYGSNDVPVSDEFKINQESYAREPSVGMDDTGDFAVTYLRDGNSSIPGYYMQLRQYNADGTPKDDAVTLSENLGCNMGPEIAVNGSGDFALAWAENLNNDNFRENDIHTQRFNSDATAAGQELVVNTTLPGLQSGGAIAMNDVGESMVIWSDFERDGAVYARIYDKDGNPIGGEILLSSYAVTGMTALMSVALNNNGQYVAVWTSDNFDGDGYGVFCQTGTIPEPATFSLLLSGTVTLLLRRSKRS